VARADYALTHQVVHDLEHLSFVIVGMLVWIQLVDPARRRELGLTGKLALAIALFAAGQILADVLIFAMRPLYPSYADQPDRLLGLSPLQDQRLAGLVMMGEQLLTLGTFVALLLIAQHRRLFRPTEDERRVAA
jgi:cytochrome c oxidase assembly factor CtaG